MCSGINIKMLSRKNANTYMYVPCCVDDYTLPNKKFNDFLKIIENILFVLNGTAII